MLTSSDNMSAYVLNSLEELPGWKILKDYIVEGKTSIEVSCCGRDTPGDRCAVVQQDSGQLDGIETEVAIEHVDGLIAALVEAPVLLEGKHADTMQVFLQREPLTHMIYMICV